MTGSDLAKRPAWTPGSSAFTPPSTVPARPFPTELRQAKAFPAKQARRPEASASKKSTSRSHRIGTVLLSMLVVVLVVAAGTLVWSAFQTGESIEAPLPAAEFDSVPGEVTGPTGEEGADVDGVRMTAADMKPNTLFIPALSVYMPIEQSSQFVSSRYAGFDTLKVPKNSKHGVRYGAGAPMYGGDAGVTMIASHVSSSTGWGALRHLYKLTGGEMIYTKDSTGQLQSWQTTKMHVENHTDFPQEYWSAEGERMLVITTCGGGLTRDRHYKKNIFVVAAPVDPKPAAPAEAEAQQPIEG